MKSLSIASEEGRKIKTIITEFLYATHGYGVGKVEIDSMKKHENQIEIHGKYDIGGILAFKWVKFTMVLDADYRLLSYERTPIEQV